MAQILVSAAALRVVRWTAIGVIFLVAAPLHAAELDELLKEYRAFGLPEPPARATIVQVRETTIGFAVLPQPMQREVDVLIGTRNSRIPSRLVAAMKRDAAIPKKAITKQSSFELLQYFFPEDMGVATAIQCHARGETKLAAAILAAALEPQRVSHFIQPERKCNAFELLHITAWCCYLEKLVEPKSNRAEILQRMREIAAADKTGAIHGAQVMLKQLEATLAPSKAAPGTPEAAIDALVDYYDRFPSVYPEAKGNGVLDTGFNVVPALIAHVNDRRLTRCITLAPSSSNGGLAPEMLPPIHTVGDICVSLLKQLGAETAIDEEWFTGNDVRVGDDDSIDPSPAREWFAAVQREGEETYAIKHLFSKECNDRPCANSALAWIIAKRYPQHLSMIYRTLLSDHADHESGDLPEFIAGSSLSREEKIALFIAGAKQPVARHQCSALLQLKLLGAREFNDAMIAAFAHHTQVKNASAKETDSEDDEARANAADDDTQSRARLITLALACECNDERVWIAIRAAVDRSDASQRIEYLEALLWDLISYDAELIPLRQRRIDLAAAYLDDLSICALPKNEYESDLTPIDVNEGRVCDKATEALAKLLAIKVEPKQKWTKNDWDRLRAEVRAALKSARPPGS
jgi:hypothetical protein